MGKRSAPRQKTFLRGFAYFGSGPLAVECLVQELSETGARIKFFVPQPATNDIELHILIKGQKRAVKVVWRAADEIGVAFVEASKGHNSEPSDGELSDRVAKFEDEIAALKKLLKHQQTPTGIEAEAA